MLAALAAAVSAGTPCTSDGDCTANEFCRATYSATGACLFTTLECTPRGGVGTYCGGLVSPCKANRCLPGMVCKPQIPLIPDQPGICQWEPCNKDAKVCPDGTVVSRDPENNCEFFPCKDCTKVRCELPVCKDGYTPVVLEGDCCPTCQKHCKLSDGTRVPHGWTGQGIGGDWCNTCTCEKGTLSCTELDCTLKCCDPAEKTLARCREGCICCGETGEWVGSHGDARTYTCAGVTQSGPDYTPPFYKPCPQCKRPDGTVVAEGWSGQGTGDNWCNKCWCKDGVYGCTKKECTTKCCDPADKTKAVCREGCICCGATGTWVGSHGDGKTFTCAGVTQSGPDYTSPFDKPCPQCKRPDGTVVAEGWSGQGTGDNWCNKCWCRNGVYGCTKKECTTKCCDPADKTKAVCREGCICCGATGTWVGSHGDGKTFTCAGVTQSGPDYTSPFDKPCPQCKRPDGTVVAEGWSGQGTGDNWCNKCWCKDGVYGCTKKECTTKCCDPADKTKAVCREGCICCGATGTWVGSHGDGKTFTCAGVTQSGPDYTSPFDKPCPQCKRPDGTVVAEGWSGQGTGDNWCNKCWCRNGVYGCTKKECTTKCCDPADKTKAVCREGCICCGATGTWVGSHGDGKTFTCAGVTQSGPDYTSPFDKPCPQCKRPDGTVVAEGWSGQGTGDNWCNKCWCKDGVYGCTKKECTTKCCDPADKTKAVCREGCICCGATGTWVGSHGDGKTFTCAGVTQSGPDYTSPFDKPCPQCKRPDGTVVAEGWSGQGTGDNWCNKCWCKDGVYGCTKKECTTKCCDPADKTKAVCREGCICCGATGTWVGSHGDGKTFTCAGVTQSGPDYTSPFDKPCPQCKRPDGTVVAEGWSGQGTGDNWCNKCWCRNGVYGCTKKECTTKCCDPADKTKAVCREGCICCGATGTWVGSHGDGKTFTCAGVTQSGPDYTSPFDKPCPQCKRPDGTVVAEGWSGQGTGDNWCNKCWCRNGVYGCTKKECTTKCCDPADKTKAVCREGCICCGATGTWVGSHGDGKTFTCAGVTQSGPDYTSPFDKPCPQCKRPDGTVVAEGWSGQGTGDNWCNKCWCRNGVYGCTKKECTTKCCDPADKTKAVCREGCICCGATGTWVGSHGDGKTFTCAGVTQSGPDYTSPFDKPCPQCKRPDGTVVAEGWSGQGTGDNWCNKCWCRNGVYGCTKKECTTKCCDPADKTKAVCREGCICCGATGTWVGSHGDGKTFTCAGVTQSGPDYTSPFDKPCPQCKRPDGTVVAEGWSGQGTGDNWCNKCWCRNGVYGCTKKECPECRPDVKTCPDGSVLHRDPLNRCLFPKCPLECAVTCGGIAGVLCDSGFTCVDIATDDCDPKTGGADCLGCCERVVCTKDAHICRDGSLVYRDPTKGCKFAPCPLDV